MVHRSKEEIRDARLIKRDLVLADFANRIVDEVEEVKGCLGCDCREDCDYRCMKRTGQKSGLF